VHLTDHHTYGTSTYTASEFVRLVSDRLGLVFIDHDSFYQGTYHLAGSRRGRIEIQPNPIPGGEGEDGLYATEHPDAQVLLLMTTPEANRALHTRLASVEGLIHLSHEAM
jgi:hypothetical protein